MRITAINIVAVIVVDRKTANGNEKEHDNDDKFEANKCITQCNVTTKS